MKSVVRRKKMKLICNGLISSIRRTTMYPENPEYVYVFVRQDLSKEQQLVQAAHVTLVLGNKLKRTDVSELYFTVIGIPQLIDFKTVFDDLHRHGTKYETFYEPDQGSTLTAVATHPIRKADRGNLLKYKLLKL